jgi:hypothetical protein
MGASVVVSQTNSTELFINCNKKAFESVTVGAALVKTYIFAIFSPWKYGIVFILGLRFLSEGCLHHNHIAE